MGFVCLLVCLNHLILYLAALTLASLQRKPSSLSLPPRLQTLPNFSFFCFCAASSGGKEGGRDGL